MNSFDVNTFNALVERVFGHEYDLVYEDDLGDDLFVQYKTTDTRLSVSEAARLVAWMRGENVFAPGPEILCSLMAAMNIIANGETTIYL